MNEVEKILTAARTRLILDKPFLGALVLRLPMHETTQNWCQSTATDARSLFYNPEYISSLNLSEVQFVLAHEALHCGLSHFARREHRNRLRWDVACDHAVNQMLLEDGLAPPHGALVNESFNGMTAEEIYPFIKPDTDEEPLDRHLYDGTSETNDDQKHNNTNDVDTNNNEAPVNPPPPLSPAEKDELNSLWQQRLAGAAQQASQAGKLNGSVARIVNRLIHSSVPWRSVLARFMSRYNQTDYNMMRPSQRRSGDFIQPSLSVRSTDIVIALDTSGSIENTELNTFIGEVNAIKGLVNARITLVACDSKLDEDGPWVFESWQKLQMPKQLAGRGGTDFRPVFEWLKDTKYSYTAY